MLVIRWARFSDDELSALLDHLDSQPKSMLALKMAREIRQLLLMRRHSPYDESHG
jgi:hypothetical protein